MAENTLGEFSDGEDDFVFEIVENDPWSDSETDDLIRNINEEEVLSELHGVIMTTNLYETLTRTKC